MTQADRGRDHPPYWPKGFEADLEDLFSGDLDEDQVSERLGEVTNQAAAELAEAMLAKPRSWMEHELGLEAGFNARLAIRWGAALDLFDLAVQNSSDVGVGINKVLRPAAAAEGDHQFEALIRLHGKAVMCAREVGVLLRHGYSSGAMARWRTLHEVWVVSSLLGDGDRDLARRYLAHEAVESMKAQEDYEQTYEALGYSPPVETPQDRGRQRAVLGEEFGSEFLKDYGWAAPLFEGRAPRLTALQAKADLGHWRGFYRMASHGTHANPKGVLWNIQADDFEDIIWAGASNAGLADPADCTLIALTNVTILLLRLADQRCAEIEQLLPERIEGQVQMRKVLLLMKHAQERFVEIAAEQRRQEKAATVLADRVTVAVRAGATSPEAIAAALGLSVDEVEDGIHRAVDAGEVRQVTSYIAPAQGEE